MKHFLRRGFGSLKQQLIFYNVVLLVFVLLVVVFSNQSNVEALANYSAFSAQYNDLSSFYRELNVAAIAAQNHLYTKSPDELISYETHLQVARTHLKRIGQSTQSEGLRWRTQLLDNMAITHRETLARLIANKPFMQGGYAEEYDFLVSTANNIANTAPQYYNLLTDEMNRSSQMLEQRWQQRIVITLVSTICMVLLGALFSSLYIFNITAPIGKIVKNIQQIKQGQYDLHKVSPAGREIAVLCEAFDDMAQSVQLHIASVEENAQLETKLLETENRNLKMNELLMETELKALQGQMNPHFLFNTLSMISKMAYMENAPETSAMMETVADLLRYSLDKSSKTSDLFGEIECVRNYFEIQNKRMGHRVALSLRITYNLRNMSLPGMVLQPLIENAILHGVSQMTRGARIEVCVYQDATSTYLSVEDNGRGIEPETLARLLLGQEEAGKTRANIGLRNVLKRLHIFYGDAFAARIASDLGEGTLVLLTLPMA